MGAFLTIDGYQYFNSRSTLWGWPGQNPIRWSDPSGNHPLPPYAQQQLAPFFPNFDLNQIDVQQGIPSIITAFSPITPAAVTLGNTIYIDPSAYDPNTSTGLALLAHEITHSEQYAELGELGFLWRYYGAYRYGRNKGLPGDRAYEDMYLEVLARLREQEVKKVCK